jgi:serine phosphatase RsbU (regulator of sigma subunit)
LRLLSIEIAVAKTHKYASRDSGDTAETVERPTGGLSVVLVDGQGSGAAAKSLSMMVSSKAVGLLKEGVRDGAVARGTHDFLHAYRKGRVSATLDIVSVDLVTSTVVVTRNSDVPYILRHDGAYAQSSNGPGPIGLYRHTRPAIDQYPIEEGLAFVLFTDGIPRAGERSGQRFEPFEYVRSTFEGVILAHDIADMTLAAAIEADSGRPNDDMTVVAVTIGRKPTEQPLRTLRVSLPFPG